MKRSRPSQWGFLGSYRRMPPKYRAVAISTAESELVGCPEPAVVVLVMMSRRMARARTSKSANDGVCVSATIGPPGRELVVPRRAQQLGWKISRSLHGDKRRYNHTGTAQDLIL